MEGQFRIKIAETQFATDGRQEEFIAVNSKACKIPLSQFRHKAGDWYILWDKQGNRYYDASAQPPGLPIPLSVEWVKIVFLDENPQWKETLDLIILLSETITLIRMGNHAGRANRNTVKLKKSICLFNAA